MSKLLQRLRDAMSSRKSKSKRPSQGSDSSTYEDAYESQPPIGGDARSSFVPYRTDDYGSRFGSYGTPRPGTYGAGDYGANVRTTSYGSDYGSRSNGGGIENGSSSAAPYGQWRGYGDAPANGGLSRGRTEFQNGWRYSNSSGNQAGSVPTHRAQRNGW